MWVKPLLTLLRGTLWDKGHAGGNAMITVCNMSWQNGATGVPMVCAGTLQCLQRAQSICSLGFEELILFSLLWRSCSPSWRHCPNGTAVPGESRAAGVLSAQISISSGI